MLVFIQKVDAVYILLLEESSLLLVSSAQWNGWFKQILFLVWSIQGCDYQKHPIKITSEKCNIPSASCEIVSFFVDQEKNGYSLTWNFSHITHIPLILLMAVYSFLSLPIYLGG